MNLGEQSMNHKHEMLKFGKYRVYPKCGHWIADEKHGEQIGTYPNRTAAIAAVKTKLWAYKEAIREQAPRKTA